MADIKEIDYDQMISRASELASEANEMQNAVKEAFSKMDSMREDWFGQSYDNFVNSANMSITSLNNIFEVTVSDIPHEIAAKAKSYASANQSSVSASLNEQVPVILTELQATGKGSKVRFRSAEVSSDQSAIKGKFEDAKASAEKASATAEALKSDWQSISGDTNIQELKVAFARLKTILDSLGTSLDGQIRQQATTIEILENAAGAAKAVGEFADNAVDAAVDAAKSATAYIQQTAADVWTNLTGKN